MKITGKVWKFPQDDINTGLIRKQQYNHLPYEEQARHCLESLDPQFASKARPGDIIVAGRNFGCGSSTPAQHSIKGLGIAAIVAESFGKLFLSNCASSGLWPVSCSGIVGLVDAGDIIEIDMDCCRIRNVATGRTLPCTPLPALFREMIELGGEKAYLKARLALQRSTERA
jgi:3-isopropylmalate/(R)-2-methylmalate dehydratase small subunit